MPDNGVVENHQPLLGSKQIKRLDVLSKGLNLNTSTGQEQLLTMAGELEGDMNVDHVLEYLVNVRDVLVGDVISAIRLSPDCNTARRIHWGVEQVKRHKARSGRPVAV